MPAECDSPPLVVWIHGGAWVTGSRKRFPGLVEEFAREGSAGASVSYRSSREDTVPAQIRDVETAIRWLCAHVDEYGHDGDVVAVRGSSAGGHLAALAGTSGGVDEPEDDGPHSGESSRVQAAMPFAAPANFLEQSEHRPGDGPDRPGSPESLLIGCPIRECPEETLQADPNQYVTGEESPFLLMHGLADETVPYQQSELPYETFRDTCGDATRYAIEGVEHGPDQFVDAFTATPPRGSDIRTTVDCQDASDGASIPQERTPEGPPPSFERMRRFLDRALTQ